MITQQLLSSSQTRRSMVFAKHLRVVGDEFRNKYLDSTDEADKTHYNEDWAQMKVFPFAICLSCNIYSIKDFVHYFDRILWRTVDANG